MKVLLSAYSCSPTAGSEPAIGWNWAKCIAASGHEVFVMTRAINLKGIEAFIHDNPMERMHFVFHDLPLIVQKLYKLPFGNYVYYCLWQYTAAQKAARIHATEKFDRVQHITWGSFRLPSFMGKLGVPFIFGPVAGGEDTPKQLRKGLGLRGRVWDALRRFSNSIFAAVPFVKATYSQAAEIVATTPETLEKIPAAYRRKARVQQAVGIDSENLVGSSARDSRNSGPRNRTTLELLYVGRLLPWKGLHLGFRALAMLGERASSVHLTIVGSGSDEMRLKTLSRRLKIEGQITWKPWMPREELIGVYADYDVFLFPSLHDSGGIAVLEAMTRGLPVLCLDLGGPGMSVDNTSGRAIATAGRSEHQVAEAIAQFLKEVSGDPNLLTRLSHGARRRAHVLNWAANVRALYVAENLVPQLN
jgi:glycosyltransferase involved in cell wall biosynthesis